MYDAMTDESEMIVFASISSTGRVRLASCFDFSLPLTTTSSEIVTPHMLATTIMKSADVFPTALEV